MYFLNSPNNPYENQGPCCFTLPMKTVIFFAIVLFGFSSPAFSKEKAKIALVQYDADSYFGNYTYNLTRLLVFAEQAVQKGAKIIVFPEGSTNGYSDRENVWHLQGTENPRDEKIRRSRRIRLNDIEPILESVPKGTTTLFWERWAKEKNVFIVFSVFEKEKKKAFNTMVTVGPEGYVGKYRKRDLYWKVDSYFATPGSEPFVLKTPYGSFGLLICMDMIAYETNWYEEYRALGANAIIVSMNWDDQADGADPAAAKAAEMAKDHQFDIYVSDSARWDGTGKYDKQGKRHRFGLPSDAVGVDGLSLHELEYSQR